MGKPKLRNAAQALKIRMLDKIKDQLIRNGDEPVNGIIENFVFINE